MKRVRGERVEDVSRPPGVTGQKQSQRFIKAAREHGADQSEEDFDKALRKIARAPVRKGQKDGKPEEPQPDKE